MVVVLAIAVRLAFLGVDPPLDASWSHDLYTDPPHYTSYARNAVIFGEWNPLNDDRLVFFLKNITGVAAYVVFTVLGPSVAAGHLVAILLNLIAVALLAWGMGRAFGFVAGWATAFLLSVNYLFVNYGRLPFLEVASSGCLVAALLALIASERRWWWAVVGGLVAGIGTFFGKITALHAVPVFLITAALIGWQAGKEPNVRRWGRPIGFAGGFAVVFLGWYIYAYLPASAEVLAYLKEQSLSLYGTPVGLTSIGGFVASWFSFGLGNPNYPSPITWSPVLGSLGVAGMLVWVVRSARGKGFRGLIANLSPAGFAVLGWFWSAYAAFMPFNYRPARYQVVLLFPLAAMAGWFVGWMAERKPVKGSRAGRGTAWFALPILTVILATGLQHLVMSGLFSQRQPASFNNGVLLAVVLGLGVSAVAIALSRSRGGKGLTFSPRVRQITEVAVGALLLVFLLNQGRHFERWWSGRKQTIVSANQDLQRILNDGAILTGGWGTPLTQDKRLGNFPAMFGVSEPDLEFFRKYPVTHVAEVDQPDLLFYKTYPTIVEQSERVTTYLIRNMPIAIYRVAAAGGNPQATSYQPSCFERMRARCKEIHRDSVLAFLPAWIADSADHYSGWRWLADLYYSADRLADAQDAYKRAARSFPHDFSLWALIGDVSWEIFRTGGSGEYRQEAIAAWNRALQLNPGHRLIRERLTNAYGR